MAKKIKAKKAATSQSTTQSRKKQFQQQMYLLVGVSVAGVVLILGIIFVNQLSAGSAQAIGENETYAGIPMGGQFADAREVELASDVAEGVVRGIDDDGIPFIGHPDAPIQIAEFADFSCPACAQYEPTVTEMIRDFVRDGSAAFYYYPLPASTRDPEASNAARASWCAGEQGGFWEMHDEIFRVHNAESYLSFTPDRLEDMANDIGLDGGEMRECMNTNRPTAGITNAARVANDLGANGTPTVAYRLLGQESWLPFRAGQNISGGIPYDALASRIREANGSPETGG